MVKLFQAPERSITKKAFRSVTVTKSLFASKLKDLSKQTFVHHQLDHWQRDTHCTMMKSIPFGQLLIQMDFAENIKLIVRQQK